MFPDLPFGLIIRYFLPEAVLYVENVYGLFAKGRDMGGADIETEIA